MAFAWGRVGRVRVRVDGDVVLGEFGFEDVVVVVVAEGVEGFVRVFDGEFADRAVVGAGAVDGAVEFRAVTSVLVWGDDYELGDAQARGELRHGDGFREWERAVGDFGFLAFFGVGLAVDAIRRGISDERVWRP